MDWNFATTLIGSQPYKNSVEAIDKTLDGRVSCPSWPQLPARGYKESMYVQTGAHLPGLKIDGDKAKVDLSDYDPTEAYTAIVTEDVDYFVYPADLYAGFFELLERDVSAFQAVKGQVTGPISEGLQILDADDRPVIYDEAYGEIVRKTVNMSAKWQAKRLSSMNSNVIIFFDEPSLSMLGTPFASISDEEAMNWINEALDGVDCYRGVHCCGNTNWSMLLKTNIDILSIDAYQYGENLVMFPDELTEFYEKGGAVAWGIVPSSDEAIEAETVESLVARMESIFDKMEEKGINRQRAASRSLITPQCGLGLVDPDNIDKVFDLLQGVSKALRERYGLQ